jgi:type I restriction enzyme S subunit
MIEGLKPYAEYKESGLSWADRLPRHWALRRLKTVFREVDSRTKTGRETLLSLRAKSGLVDHHAVGGRMIPPESLINYKRVKPGQIVMNRMRASAGLFAIPPQEGLVSPDYSVLSPQAECSLRYFVELFKTPQMGAIFRSESHGLGTGESGFLRLYFNSFGPITAPFPPKEEQEAIVRFLAHANHKIDGFIRAKRKLIGLLNEQKQAIIHQAVTRGLDPSVPLKPSGIPWLGDIPKNWEVTRVKNEFKCLNPQRIPLSSPERGAMTSRLYDYYGASGVIDKVEDYIFDDELLLIAEDGANLVLRNLPLAIIAKGKFWVNNHAHILKPKRGSLEYLAGFMETLNFQPWISGAAQPKLTKDRLMGIALAVAPTSDQSAIVEHFQKDTAPLRTAIARTDREIALMQEYRTRLTADLVTGKLDVREAASKLPDVVDLTPAQTTEDADETEEAMEEEA